MLAAFLQALSRGVFQENGNACSHTCLQEHVSRAKIRTLNSSKSPVSWTNNWGIGLKTMIFFHYIRRSKNWDHVSKSH